ncbi:MAG: hypothetical protein IH602_21070 [Bryobacteraceae bacterium]|nr:hypothetical protein [Bryobacteraceae bacterium]
MNKKQMLGMIVAGAGIMDVVIAMVILDSMARTVVLMSGVVTIAVGVWLLVAGLRSAGG